MTIEIHPERGRYFYEREVEEKVSYTRPPNQNEIDNRLWWAGRPLPPGELYRPAEVEEYRKRKERHPFPEMRPYQ